MVRRAVGVDAARDWEVGAGGQERRGAGASRAADGGAAAGDDGGREGTAAGDCTGLAEPVEGEGWMGADDAGAAEVGADGRVLLPDAGGARTPATEAGGSGGAARCR